MSNTEQDRPGTADDAIETEDSQVKENDAAKDDELEDLDDMEFMLDEIENRIAPLA